MKFSSSFPQIADSVSYGLNECRHSVRLSYPSQWLGFFGSLPHLRSLVCGRKDATDPMLRQQLVCSVNPISFTAQANIHYGQSRGRACLSRNLEHFFGRVGYSRDFEPGLRKGAFHIGCDKIIILDDYDAQRRHCQARFLCR